MKVKVLHVNEDEFDLVHLNRATLQYLAAACQVTAYEWRMGPIHSQNGARILDQIATEIVMGVFASTKTREAHETFKQLKSNSGDSDENRSL